MKGEIATFRRAAEQRLLAAEHLLRVDSNLDAVYLAGYSVECILKAVILEFTSVSKREEVYHRISKGSAMHGPEMPGTILKKAGAPLPLELAKLLRTSDWSPALRYQTGRVSVRDAEAFLETVEQVVKWAEGKPT